MAALLWQTALSQLQLSMTYCQFHGNSEGRFCMSQVWRLETDVVVLPPSVSELQYPLLTYKHLYMQSVSSFQWQWHAWKSLTRRFFILLTPCLSLLLSLTHITDNVSGSASTCISAALTGDVSKWHPSNGNLPAFLFLACLIPCRIISYIPLCHKVKCHTFTFSTYFQLVYAVLYISAFLLLFL